MLALGVDLDRWKLRVERLTKKSADRSIGIVYGHYYFPEGHVRMLEVLVWWRSIHLAHRTRLDAQDQDQAPR